MERGIDHLVLAVRDLDAAAEAYGSLGFTLTPTARHSWGTSNRLVQLNGCFMEIIAVTDESRLPAPRQFSFGLYLRDFLRRREGFAMLVFESRAARADRDEFAEKRLSDFDRFDFERQTILPDGTTATVGFSLAFVAPVDMPEAVFFTCQQHAPQYFWKPDYQRHANGAAGIAAVTMVATDPEMARPVLAGLQGEAAVDKDEFGLHAATARGWVDVMTPKTFQDWYGGDTLPPSREGPCFTAARIAVPDLGMTESLLKKNSVPHRWTRAGLTVPPDYLHGTTIAFVQVEGKEMFAPQTVTALLQRPGQSGGS